MSTKNIVRVGVVGAALLLAGSLAGCSSSGSSAASSSSSASTASASRPGPTGVVAACTPKSGGQNGKLLIGVVDIDEQTAFFTQLNQGIKDVAKKAGAAVRVINGQDDSQTQSNAIDNLVTSGANVIVVDPYDNTALIPAIDRAVAAGVKVVTTDGQVTGDSKVSTWVGTANSDGGKQLGKFLLKQTKGKGTVGVVSALNSGIQIQRQNGFQNTVKAGGMKIGKVVDGHNVNDQAQTAAENLLTASPNLKYLYATGEPALNGAIAAAKSQGVTSTLSIVGWDLSQQSADALKSGFVKGVVQQDSFGFGYESAKAAIKLACGGNVPSTISVPIHIVTKSNLNKYSYYLEK